MNVVTAEPKAKTNPGWGIFENALDRVYSRKEISRLQKFLDRCGPILNLPLLLRVRPRHIDEIRASRGQLWFILPDILRRSMFETTESDESPLSKVSRAWHDVVGPDSPWRDVVVLPGVHACMIRGPVDAVRRFFDSDLVKSESSPISGVVPPIPVVVPEHRFFSMEDPEEADALIRTIEGIIKLYDANLTPEQIADSFLREFNTSARTSALDQLIGAMRSRQLEDGPNRLRRILSLIRKGRNYIDELGIGTVSRLGESAGDGKTVCVVDSGLDESLPVFRGRVEHHEKIDGIGHRKKAHDCTDSGCHGTKMSSIICANPTRLANFGIGSAYCARLLGVPLEATYGLSDSSSVRFSIAPKTRIVTHSALTGEHGAETAALPVILSALNSVAEDHRIHAVNISIEMPRSHELFDVAKDVIGRACLFLKRAGKQVIVAAGNHGPKSGAVASSYTDSDTKETERVACVVGAANREGVPSEMNGPEVDVLATGVDVLCVQPVRERLGGDMLALHSGSSFATAVASGCLAGLCSRFPDHDPVKVGDTLIATSRGPGDTIGMINVDAAIDKLEGKTY